MIRNLQHLFACQTEVVKRIYRVLLSVKTPVLKYRPNRIAYSSIWSASTVWIFSSTRLTKGSRRCPSGNSPAKSNRQAKIEFVYLNIAGSAAGAILVRSALSCHSGNRSRAVWRSSGRRLPNPESAWRAAPRRSAASMPTLCVLLDLCIQRDRPSLV